MGKKLERVKRRIIELYRQDIESGEFKFSVAPSAVCRAELAFLGLEYPRFAHRIKIKDVESGGEGFCSFRRLKHHLLQLQNIHLIGSRETDFKIDEIINASNPVAESVFPYPSIFADEFAFFVKDFKDVFGVDCDCLGTAYSSMLEFGGGVCSHAVAFMAMLQMEEYCESLLTPPEISYFFSSNSFSNLTNPIPIKGFGQPEFIELFEDRRIGLSTHWITIDRNNTHELARRSPRLQKTHISSLIPYVNSGIPFIFKVPTKAYFEKLSVDGEAPGGSTPTGKYHAPSWMWSWSQF